MSEWLTTGEMIDRLKEGEVAECDSCSYKVMFKKTEGLVYVDDEGKTKTNLGFHGKFIIGNSVLKDQFKWRIRPRYVSFEEAMKALKLGKKVRFHVREGKSIPFTSQSYLENIYSVHGCSLSWEYLLEGKWSIEE
jgi:NAD+--asparagine ADP-ribosyltransferase